MPDRMSVEDLLAIIGDQQVQIYQLRRDNIELVRLLQEKTKHEAVPSQPSVALVDGPAVASTDNPA